MSVSHLCESFIHVCGYSSLFCLLMLHHNYCWCYPLVGVLVPLCCAVSFWRSKEAFPCLDMHFAQTRDYERI